MVDAPSEPTISALRRRLETVLQRVPVYDLTSMLGAKAAGLVRRSRQLDRYLTGIPPEKRCLSIGSGPDVIDGWLATDLIPLKRETMYLDATKPWPMPSASFRYMACEHMIEHVPYDAGLRVLSEAHRVLQPGGVLRISTPNLDVIRLLPDSDDPDVHDYVRWFNRSFGSAAQREDESNPVHALNLVMHEFGHIYLYNERSLRQTLMRAGFRQIIRCEPKISGHPELVDIDRHADLIPDAANRVESLILEATV